MSYKFPDGQEIGPFYNYTRSDYVVIVARDKDGNYVCVRQYRHGIKKVTCEFPAGKIEGSDTSAGGESLLDAAKRELAEETGYTSDKWRFLLAEPADATLSDNFAYFFAADDCEKTVKRHLDDTEFLDVKVLSEEELKRLIRDGNFEQGMHIAAYFLAKE